MNHSVDVIIPLYNGGNFIFDTLKSIESQTFKPGNVIVVNDGSTDMSEHIVRKFMERTSLNVKLINKKNGGLSSARNIGIVNSESEYVAFLDADDLWYPDKLQRQMECFKNAEFKDLGLVYCGYEILKGNRKIKKNLLLPQIEKDLRGNVFEKMFDKMKISASGSGVLIKRDCFDKAGMFDESLFAVEDWDMWIRISRYFAIDYVPDILVSVRIHDQNMHHDNERMLRNFTRFALKWCDELSSENISEKMTRKLSIKMMDYLFKSLLTMRLGAFSGQLRLLESVLNENEKQKLFFKTNGSIKWFLLYSFPFYVKKQIQRFFRYFVSC